MVSVPTGRTVVEMGTAPAEMVPEPRGTRPLVKVMVPVAVVGTVAVMETLPPKLLVPGVVTLTVGVILVTTTLVAGEVAGLLLPSPGVVAVMELVPVGSEG